MSSMTVDSLDTCLWVWCGAIGCGWLGFAVALAWSRSHHVGFMAYVVAYQVLGCAGVAGTHLSSGLDPLRPPLWVFWAMAPSLLVPLIAFGRMLRSGPWGREEEIATPSRAWTTLLGSMLGVAGQVSLAWALVFVGASRYDVPDRVLLARIEAARDDLDAVERALLEGVEPVSPDRLARLQRTLRARAPIQAPARLDCDRVTIPVTFRGGGAMGRDEEKGICWVRSGSPEAAVVDDLDDWEGADEVWTAYRHVRGRWFLFKWM